MKKNLLVVVVASSDPGKELSQIT